MEGRIGTDLIRVVNKRYASADILCVGNRALKETFGGIIRFQDVRKTEIDKVVMYKAFRPGDVVRAQVLSLGDSRSFYLTTAEVFLGVIFATSMAGETMEALSHEEMICPKTQAVESRKVAKVDQEEEEEE
eukprot:TRINITY_DN2609_c1_g1_i4.p1 TRINITY_DN2609_c1_g1~~TRINITY_DN2609_c1_g1_i4.p1  ORF type:complete len:131 (-),score=16.61 TRINITY_DN2609_c1_g1_i4:51-443(-)